MFLPAYTVLHPVLLLGPAQSRLILSFEIAENIKFFKNSNFDHVTHLVGSFLWKNKSLAQGSILLLQVTIVRIVLFPLVCPKRRAEETATKPQHHVRLGLTKIACLFQQFRLPSLLGLTF